MPFVLGIEGYLKTGKTTLGKTLARKYNALVVDTGVLYRIIASLLLKREMCYEKIKTIVKNERIETILENLKVYYDYVLNTFVPIPNNIYSAEVSKVSAIIGAITGDKWYYMFNSIITKISKKNNTILVGRNLLRIFPKLDIHIFLVADIDKMLQLTMKEQHNLTLKQAEELFKERQANEILIRKFSIENEKTKIINISEMNETEVFQFVNNLIEKRLNI